MLSYKPLAMLLAGSLAWSVNAQEQAKPYTLNVYTNRIQVPTLVLQKRPYPPIPVADTTLAPTQFSISLDSGPLFHPTGLHIQGDDPIDLAIVLDLSKAGQIQRSLYPQIETLAKDLRPQDRISLYAFHCGAVRTADHIAVAPGTITAALRAAFDSPIGPEPGQRRCESPGILWHTMGYVMRTLSGYSGRHAVFLFSDGDYPRSEMQSLVDLASRQSLAVFAMHALHGFSFEDPVVELCIRTGGYVFPDTPDDFDIVLRNLIPNLRSRYILEFPRPDGFSQMHHSIVVKVTSTHDIPLPTGAYALGDSTDPNDPSVIRNEPSPAKLGSRRPISPK